MTRNYWLSLFTLETWQEFLKAGASVTGFRAGRWRLVQQIQEGDYLLSYLAGTGRWIAAFEVASRPFKDETPIFTSDPYPCRLKVSPLVVLTPETAVPALGLADRLSVFQRLKDPKSWGVVFQQSPRKWSEEDALVVLGALRSAEASPVERPLTPVRPTKPKTSPSKLGPVTIPDESGEADTTEPEGATAHTEIQWLLLKLGSDMGLDVWVAKNDLSKVYKGVRFSEMPRLRNQLPLQFDEATRRTVELIDVLWLSSNGILAAFEVESTTSIYSGLLRMSDLLSMQRNLNISLYIVAPDERRQRVITEINRPTFSRLTPPLYATCRYISFDDLRAKMANLGPYIQYLKPEFLDDLSQPCTLDSL
jgi:hypothetical protein